ncbi:sterile alpha motif domain-containing protein 3-like [Astyanax mexicanus]|uniref:Sterile alpha motif domain-containing protein 3-like n=1 Tax=Astyanax mexicanus TaxID=7994 RepID=A0A8T2M4Q4_ASTMX|nr:sterile alpha motif domain-containing protein 3-like [Astyanax mexicanus]
MLETVLKSGELNLAGILPFRSDDDEDAADDEEERGVLPALLNKCDVIDKVLEETNLPSLSAWYLEHLRCYEVCKNHSAKLLGFCSIEIPVYKMLLRIIINKDDIRKIQTDSEPETLDSFYSFLKCKLGLGGDFVVQFQDPDFGNEFCNLSSLSELPKEKATLKVILKQIPESPQTDSTLDTASLSSPSSSSMEDTPSCRRPWPDPFVIPKFSYDVELKLKRGNEAYQENGTLLITNKDTKSEILEKLAEEIYKYSAYPSREQYDIVAQSLVKKHPCLREPGSVKGWYCWKFSLKFKMGNYRNKLRVSGCSELTVNRRNSGPKQKLKKAKKSEVNFLPDVPEGKTQNVLEEERAAIVAEMKKKKVDWKKVTDMMASTFPLRRKEIVEEQPLVAEVKAKWPALFTDTQIEAEFARLTSTDLWDTFVSGLDQYMERFLQMFKAKSHCIQALSSLLSLLDDDVSTSVEMYRPEHAMHTHLPHILFYLALFFYVDLCALPCEGPVCLQLRTQSNDHAS